MKNLRQRFALYDALQIAKAVCYMASILAMKYL